MKVSIIVPVYNTRLYLERCLESIINQTLKEIEIIVINDGSKENIEDIIKKYENKIIYIKDSNHGIGHARNLGIKKATGEYIGFVDSDDYIEKDMYLSYYNFAKSNNLDLVVGNYYRCYKESKELIKLKSLPMGSIYEHKDILVNIDYGPCNKMFKRNLIIDNNILFEENLKYEDMPFVLKALKQSNKIGDLNKAYYNYNVRDTSETTTTDQRNFDIFAIFDIVNNYFKNDNSLKEEIEYLNVSKLLDYNIQQRKQRNRTLRNKFIDQTFNYIKIKFPNYKKNRYWRYENIFKRIVKQSKLITKIYCLIYPKQ
jgi:glycosyltransferase involved in cell wall biosynthesis